MNGSRPSQDTLEGFINWFKKEYGHYPSCEEFDVCPQAPCSTRTVQRIFGGLVHVKRGMGIAEDEVDQRRGPIRSITATKCIARSLHDENLFYRFLVELFGKMKVHRQEYYDSEIRLHKSDYCLFITENKKMYIDIFWAINPDNCIGCINLKLKKIPEDVEGKIYLVCSNPDIKKEDLYKKVARKTKKLPKNIEVIHINDFKEKITTLA